MRLNNIFFRALSGPVLLTLAACGGENSTEPPVAKPATAQPAETSQASASETAPTEAEAGTPEMTEEDMLKRGKIVFLQCRSCHSLKEGEPHRVGPNLHGIIGAPSGAKEGFVYSKALADGKIIWTEDALKKFVESPSSFAKGTRMVYVGLRKESDQDALIAYMKEETK